MNKKTLRYLLLFAGTAVLFLFIHTAQIWAADPTTCQNNCRGRPNEAECLRICINGTAGVPVSPVPIVDLNQVIEGIPQASPMIELDRTTTLGQIVSAAVLIIIPLAGIGLLLLLIWGGFKYLTSQGDAKKVEAAKGTITAAVIGFIIIVVAFTVSQIINQIFTLGGSFQ